MILDQFRLDGKVALVTGGGRGLGLGFSTALAQAGADVVIVDRSPAPEALDAIRATGRRAHEITTDLLAATPADLTALVADAVALAGRVDVLVNNAGIIRRQPAIEFSPQNWDEVIDLNLSTVFYLSQAVARVLVEQGEGGKIINIASMLSFQGGKIVPSYTASKSAVAGLTRALASEWSALGINVNAIAPGYFATDNTAQLRADDTRSAEILARIPAGRWGTPDDLQGAAVFLASAASAYVHGSVLAVDGGWLTR
ncbi:2-dehydro-3-deoxy-D-gluconate 5-dehydrogenase KduD [Cellulomonas hominis]|uniref:2-deoxy-D-gluconate 3-dehydrogenase n=1 Tax=Cellulomonas hominis TaxID=156981 RepID=A0A511FE33_9CELL|nr:2-dehydro-3-deoxy-D-gluconate 5-dehydrogenase KduD [Cellulomonas hominis]MBB5472106.1 2-deoxy-D-gluconate 3-dehydrogenase [Cellulomonas hominis]MBU5423425.1 2-dehydro-3-deoxy-D-gluconate 5-dehydrogenase KduD [Cellulomonas hominis]NKY05440.1 2-dehydro-3-deoxy-D-gluconate 5-dehydrogenase KduD [Cellulomonas hominis]GEL47505.1 2-deoxy-D-gluconate 3-dehydrogenase [Cellulomonas hominis]